MRCDFESGCVPRGVAGRGTFDDAKRSFKRCSRGADGDWKASLYQPASVVPIDRGLEIETAGIRPESDVLRDSPGSEGPNDSERHAVRTLFQYRNRLASDNFFSRASIAGIDAHASQAGGLSTNAQMLLPGPARTSRAAC